MVLMLLEQIVQLFLCIVLGWLLVRLHLLKPEDSRVLSKVCLYLVTPCVIINAFQLQRRSCFRVWPSPLGPPLASTLCFSLPRPYCTAPCV